YANGAGNSGHQSRSADPGAGTSTRTSLAPASAAPATAKPKVRNQPGRVARIVTAATARAAKYPHGSRRDRGTVLRDYAQRARRTAHDAHAGPGAPTSSRM